MQYKQIKVYDYCSVCKGHVLQLSKSVISGSVCSIVMNTFTGPLDIILCNGVSDMTTERRTEQSYFVFSSEIQLLLSRGE